MKEKGFVVWFTGLSGAGKSTLAQKIKNELEKRGLSRIEVLDGDIIRENLSKGLGFSREDRDTNIRRIGFVSSLLSRNGAVAITAAISPYAETREHVRRLVGDTFVEIYVKCSLDKCIERDTKGLYAKALKGEIKEFTGVSDPYEPPSNPAATVETDKESIEVSTAKIMKVLESLSLIRNSNEQQTLLENEDTPALLRTRTLTDDVRSHEGTADKSNWHGLIPPHGGKLVNRLFTDERLDSTREEINRILLTPSFENKIVLTASEVSDVELIATGAFSPLEGFMGSEDYQSVLNYGRLANALAWTIPITLAVEKEFARGLREGDKVVLLEPDGSPLAVLNLSEKYMYDKTILVKKVWGTTDPEHPFLRTILAQGDVFLAGKLDVLRLPEREIEAKYRLTPSETRRKFMERNWRSVVAFQTRNPIHRAHEHLTKVALELVDGLLIHPLVGATKSDDIPAAVRMKCYETLLENYYPHDRTMLAVMPAAMRYGGPKEAIMHSIIRQNYGCSHIIIGRDHAGVGNYYDPFAAHRIFGEYSKEELAITPVKFSDAFYCTVCGTMASSKTCSHDASSRSILSGTAVRNILSQGQTPPETFTRKEVAEVLLDYYRSVRRQDSEATPSYEPVPVPNDHARL